jgi:hypothetical protein
MLDLVAHGSHFEDKESTLFVTHSHYMFAYVHTLTSRCTFYCREDDFGLF